jgi:hypothetical protein
MSWRSVGTGYRLYLEQLNDYQLLGMCPVPMQFISLEDVLPRFQQITGLCCSSGLQISL